MNKHNLFIFNSKYGNKKFFLKLAIFFILILFYVNYILPQYEGSYNSSLIDKVDRLESIDGAKLVLIGNSNLPFGINSADIEEAMCMPVVNMGLHGGLGNAFHENMAKLNVTEGDIYVICHSSYNTEKAISDPVLAWTTIENHYKLWKILKWKDFKTMTENFPVYLKKCLDLYISGKGNEDNGSVYSRSAFNKYGDISIDRYGSEYTFDSVVSIPDISKGDINRINELNKYLNDRGANLLIAGYPIGNGELTVDAKEFIAFQEQLKQQLDCDIISNYVDYMFDYGYFYNTNLHLNTYGVEIRTKQLISDLKTWQKNKIDASIETDEYEDILSDVNLPHITELGKYITILEKGIERYTVFISINKNGEYLENKYLKKFSRLNLNNISSNNDNYIAVIDKNIVYEKAGKKQLKYNADFDKKLHNFLIISNQNNSEDTEAIVIDGIGCLKNKKGINIVVYSNETHRVLDKVTFKGNGKRVQVLEH